MGLDMLYKLNLSNVFVQNYNKEKTDMDIVASIQNLSQNITCHKIHVALDIDPNLHCIKHVIILHYTSWNNIPSALRTDACKSTPFIFAICSRWRINCGLLVTNNLICIGLGNDLLPGDMSKRVCQALIFISRVGVELHLYTLHWF